MSRRNETSLRRVVRGYGRGAAIRAWWCGRAGAQGSVCAGGPALSHLSPRAEPQSTTYPGKGCGRCDPRHSCPRCFRRSVIEHWAMWPNGSLLGFQEGPTVGTRPMAEPPFILLLVAADETDRRLIGELLPRAAPRCTGRRARRPRSPPLGEHPHDAVLVDAALGDEPTVRAMLEEDPRAQMILLGDPSGADAVRAARAAGAVDHLPKAALDADTLERAVRYAVRPPPQRRAPAARRAARRADRAAQPHAVPRPARAVAAPRAPPRRRVRRGGAVPRPRPLQARQRLARPPGRRPAAAAPSRSGSTRRCAPATPSRAWAATSSPCCSRT